MIRKADPSRNSLRIFLNYRREDSSGHAGRLYDDLKEHFGAGSVFMDVDTIKPGHDFMEVVEDAVGSCDAVIAVIGKRWADVTDAKGRRRLENPDDFVRLELETALKRGVRVVPALVQGAEMPSGEEFPSPLRPLSRRHAIELSDSRWGFDVRRLIAALDPTAAERSQPQGTRFRKVVTYPVASWRRRIITGVATAALTALVLTFLVGGSKKSAFQLSPNTVRARDPSGVYTASIPSDWVMSSTGFNPLDKPDGPGTTIHPASGDWHAKWTVPKVFIGASALTARRLKLQGASAKSAVPKLIKLLRRDNWAQDGCTFESIQDYAGSTPRLHGRVINWQGCSGIGWRVSEIAAVSANSHFLLYGQLFAPDSRVLDAETKLVRSFTVDVSKLRTPVVP
jgi:hypothetical protein